MSAAWWYNQQVERQERHRRSRYGSREYYETKDYPAKPVDWARVRRAIPWRYFVGAAIILALLHFNHWWYK